MMLDKKTILNIIIIFCVALVIGNAFGRIFVHIFPGLTGDPDGFNRMSIYFAANGDLGGSIRRPPAFIVFMGLVYRFFGESQNIYMFFQSLFLGILACLVYLISFETFKSRKIALFTGLITIVFPTCLWYVPRHWIELMFATFVILMVWSASKALSTPTIRNMVVFGIAAGLTSLCKSVVVLFPLFLGLAVLFLRLLRIRPFEKLKKGTLVGLILIPTMTMLLVIAPWTIRNRIVSGKWLLVSSNAGVEFFRGNIFAENNLFLPQNNIKDFWPEVIAREDEILREHGNLHPTSIEKDEIFNPIMKNYILHRPLDFALKIVKQIPAFWICGETTFKSLAFLAIALPTIILFIMGFISTRKKSYFANTAVIFIVYFNLIYAAVLALGRYSMPVYPLMLIFAVYAVFDIFNGKKKASNIN